MQLVALQPQYQPIYATGRPEAHKPVQLVALKAKPTSLYMQLVALFSAYHRLVRFAQQWGLVRTEISLGNTRSTRWPLESLLFWGDEY